MKMKTGKRDEKPMKKEANRESREDVTPAEFSKGMDAIEMAALLYERRLAACRSRAAKEEQSEKHKLSEEAAAAIRSGKFDAAKPGLDPIGGGIDFCVELGSPEISSRIEKIHALGDKANGDGVPIISFPQLCLQIAEESDSGILPRGVFAAAEAIAFFMRSERRKEFVRSKAMFRAWSRAREDAAEEILRLAKAGKARIRDCEEFGGKIKIRVEMSGEKIRGLAREANRLCGSEYRCPMFYAAAEAEKRFFGQDEKVRIAKRLDDSEHDAERLLEILGVRLPA